MRKCVVYSTVCCSNIQRIYACCPKLYFYDNFGRDALGICHFKNSSPTFLQHLHLSNVTARAIDAIGDDGVIVDVTVTILLTIHLLMTRDPEDVTEDDIVDVSTRLCWVVYCTMHALILLLRETIEGHLQGSR